MYNWYICILYSSLKKALKIIWKLARLKVKLKQTHAHKNNKPTPNWAKNNENNSWRVWGFLLNIIIFANVVVHCEHSAYLDLFFAVICNWRNMNCVVVGKTSIHFFRLSVSKYDFCCQIVLFEQKSGCFEKRNSAVHFFIALYNRVKKQNVQLFSRKA